MVRCSVVPGLRCGIRHAHWADFHPWVFAGIGVGRHNGVGHVVTDLDRGLDLATEGRTQQPVADPYNPIIQAGREAVDATIAAVLIAADAENEVSAVSANANVRDLIAASLSAR